MPKLDDAVVDIHAMVWHLFAVPLIQTIKKTMIKSLMLCVALSLCAIGLQAGECSGGKAKGACPSSGAGCDKAKDSKGTCPSGGKDSKGTCPAGGKKDSGKAS